MDTVHYPAIEARRADLGVTKRAVADRLGLSWEQASKKLSGEVEFNLTEALELAEWWGLCLDELAGREVPKCPLYRPSFAESKAG
ncbi:helix-turn-helix domain-containing protein [Paraeggerthella hongkongensis]|uniref:Transcriptional regulator n=1 Tax=Paraeggerthella hongkongensis TaxID=230658 RepID=A0A3N0BBJ9_9ACTN|nr:XRE family transcriptional regulator [Paraeggerthella hongkongensis]RNL44761.1 transcriptional regulator [Paraeggerthella hongkongensis]